MPNNSNLKHLCQAIIAGDDQQFNRYLTKVKDQINDLYLAPKHSEPLAPLHFAVVNKRKDFLVKLIENKANVDVRDINAATPLHYAAQKGFIEFVILLLPKANINARENLGRTPICLAAKNGHADVVKLLLNQPVIDLFSLTPGIMDKEYQQSALCIAMLSDKKMIVSLLIPELLKRKQEWVEIEFNKALNIATQSASLGISNFMPLVNALLLKHFNKQNAKTDTLNLLIRDYIRQGEAEKLEELIVKQGLDPNTRLVGAIEGANGQDTRCSLIMAATACNQLPIIAMLLKRNADPYLLDESGVNALYLACKNGNTEVTHLLLTHTNFIPHKIIYEIKEKISKPQKQAIMLIDEYQSQQQEEYQVSFRTLLSTAVINKHHNIIPLLLNKGALPCQTVNGLPIALTLAINNINLKIFASKNYQNEMSVFKLLMKKVQTLENSEWQPTIYKPCFLVIMSNNIEVCEIFFGHPDTNKYFDQDLKNNLLQFACICNCEHAANFLVQLGADSSIPQIGYESKTVADWLQNFNTQEKIEEEVDLPIEEISITSSTSEPPLNNQAKPLSNISKTVDENAKQDFKGFNISSELSMSGRKFLMNELNFTENDIKTLNKINKSKPTQRKIIQPKSKVMLTEYTWENGLIESKYLEVLNNNSYYFFPSLVIKQQLEELQLDSSLLEKFQNVRPKFDGKHLKPLNLSMNIIVNNNKLSITHELKIKDMKTRILVVAMKSDNNQATLYLPVLVLPNGLHSLSDTKSLQSKNKTVEINFKEELSNENIPCDKERLSCI